MTGRPRRSADDALYRLKLALNDLERATIERNLPVARYLLDTEIWEALTAVAQTCDVEREFIDFLRQAVEGVQTELGRDPR
jgi:hypothetical protein